MGNINALPSIDKLTSSDGGNVKKLMEQYETLKQDDREKVTNSALLLAAFERITAIEKQMADVEAMIKEKLEGVTVTLDTKEDIQAIDKAMEGLASTDVAKITAVEQFLSPAKVDLVNLMLKELVEDGQTVTATQENKEALQALLDEINQYYTGIPEADKKYVEGYEAVATVQAAIDALEKRIPTRMEESLSLRRRPPADCGSAAGTGGGKHPPHKLETQIIYKREAAGIPAALPRFMDFFPGRP